MMRTFKMIRDVDVTGLSGTGVVAEGIEFSDGTVVMRWLEAGVSETNRERGVRPTTVMHPSIESVEALHGHNGATHIENTEQWEPTRWYRVMDSNHELWGESSDKDEPAMKLRKGDTLERLYQTVPRTEWILEV